MANAAFHTWLRANYFNDQVRSVIVTEAWQGAIKHTLAFVARELKEMATSQDCCGPLLVDPLPLRKLADLVLLMKP